MRNIKIVIQYEGTRYSGWQVQGNTEATVCGVISEAISAVCKEKVELIGSARTDAGVHALGQVANFKTSSPMALREMKKQINDRLGHDICIFDIDEVEERFHASYNAS